MLVSTIIEEINGSFSKVEDIPVGEFVKRKPRAKKVYTRQEYNRSTKRYILQNWDDISDFYEVKKGTELFIGFDF